jgi:hypothetical protein
LRFSIPWEWTLNYLIIQKMITANFIVNRFEERGWLGLGENKISL